VSGTFWTMIVATLLGTIVWWHFTPYEDAAFWGPFGCSQAKAAHVVAKGCEDPPVPPACPCCDRCEKCHGK